MNNKSTFIQCDDFKLIQIPFIKNMNIQQTPFQNLLSLFYEELEIYYSKDVHDYEGNSDLRIQQK